MVGVQELVLYPFIYKEVTLWQADMYSQVRIL